jgi:ATP-dependent helicase Lhr and Lhr-like helicase
LWALRRMEARGAIRGGRFVSGFSGEQFAVPEAVESLRAMRKARRVGDTVRLAAADPLNLAGVLLPGPRVPALPRDTVTYVDGAAQPDAAPARA